jgi:hypothetical protein
MEDKYTSRVSLNWLADNTYIEYCDNQWTAPDEYPKQNIIDVNGLSTKDLIRVILDRGYPLIENITFIEMCNNIISGKIKLCVENDIEYHNNNLLVLISFVQSLFTTKTVITDESVKNQAIIIASIRILVVYIATIISNIKADDTNTNFITYYVMMHSILIFKGIQSTNNE